MMADQEVTGIAPSKKSLLTWHRYEDRPDSRWYETGHDGTVFPVTVSFDPEKGSGIRVPRTFKFRRANRHGRERILTADPIELTGKEWKMFVDRGHGMHSTSMITRTISRLGQTIASIERRYGIYSDADVEKISTQDKSKGDYALYQFIRATQAELKTLYELEREVDPTDEVQVTEFQTRLFNILDRARERAYEIKSHIPGTYIAKRLDHDFYSAMRVVTGFEWPLDPDVLDETRRRSITEADQLIVEDDRTYIYDPKLDISSAAGQGLYGGLISGFGSTGRDDFAHCIMRMDGFPKGACRRFSEDVGFLVSSHGVGTLASAGMKRGLRDVGRWIQNAWWRFWKRPETLQPLFTFSARPYPEKSEGKIDTTYDAALYTKVSAFLSEIELKTDGKSYSTIDDFLPGIEDKCQKRGISNPIQLQKAKAYALFQHLIALNEPRFSIFVNKITPEALNQRLVPYHDLGAVMRARKIKAEVEKQQKEFRDNVLATINEKRQELVRTDVSTDVSTEEPNKEAIKFAMEKHKDDAKALELAFQKLTPALLIPDGVCGPRFLQQSMAGNLYTISDTIIGMFESAGYRDPIYGSIALGALAITAFYSTSSALMVSGKLGLKSASGETASILGKTRLIPWVCHNVMPIGASSGLGDIGFSSFMNGIVTGKLIYMAMSMLESVKGVEGGFSQEVVESLLNNPLESAVSTLLLYGMGHTFRHIEYDFEEWGWEIIDEFAGSIKPTAIALDVLFASWASLKKWLTTDEADRQPSAEQWLQAERRLAALFVDRLLKLPELSVRTDLNRDELIEIVRKEISEPVFFAGRDAAAFEYVKAALQKKVVDALTKVVGNVAIDAIWHNLFNQPASLETTAAREAAAVKEAPSHDSFMACYLERMGMIDPEAVLKEAVLPLAVMPAELDSFKKEQSKASSKILRQIVEKPEGVVIEILPLLEKMFSKDAAKYDENVAEDVKNTSSYKAGKLTYLQGLFKDELMHERQKKSGFWRELGSNTQLRKFVETTSGTSMRQLEAEKLMPVSYKGVIRSIPVGIIRSVRALTVGAIWGVVRRVVKPLISSESSQSLQKADRNSGYDDLKAFGAQLMTVVGIAARPFIAAMPFVLGKAGGRIKVAMGGSSSPKEEGEELPLKMRWRLAYTQAWRKIETPRPTGVGLYRLSYVKTELVVKSTVQPIEIEASSLSSWVEQYKKMTYWFSPNSHIMKRVMEAVKKSGYVRPKGQLTEPDSANESKVVNSLDLLKSIFPDETKDLEQQMKERGIENDKRKTCLYASLQRLFEAEMQAAKRIHAKTWLSLAELGDINSTCGALTGKSLGKIEDPRADFVGKLEKADVSARTVLAKKQEELEPPVEKSEEKPEHPVVRGGSESAILAAESTIPRASSLAVIDQPHISAKRDGSQALKIPLDKTSSSEQPSPSPQGMGG